MVREDGLVLKRGVEAVLRVHGGENWAVVV